MLPSREGGAVAAGAATTTTPPPPNHSSFQQQHPHHHPRGDTTTNQDNRDEEEAQGRRSNNNNNNNSVIRIPLGRLEPLLRQLCDAVQAYFHHQHCARVVVNINHENDDRQQQQQQRLALLRTLADRLQQLESSLQQMLSFLSAPTTTTSSTTYPDRTIQVEAREMEFLTLPLLALLRIWGDPPREIAAGGGPWSCCCGKEENEEDSDLQAVQQSALWKCLERSCRILRIALTATYPQCNNNNSNNDNKFLHKCLDLALLVLPSGPQVEQTIRRQHRRRPRLDRGEDGLRALLELLQTVVALRHFGVVDVVPGNHPDNDGEPDVWVTGVVPRLLETCIAILEPPTKKDDDDDNGDKDSSTATTTTVDAGTELQCTALETIRQLQNSCLNDDTTAAAAAVVVVWRRAFPGVYAGLYRRTLHSLRVSHAQRQARHVVLGSVDCLHWLLQCTCGGGIQPRRRRGNAIMLSKTTTTTTTTAQQSPVSAFFDSLQQQQTTLAAAPIATKGEKLEDDDEQEEQRFFEQINQRLPSTLNVLGHLLSQAQSALVRAKAMALLSTVWHMSSDGGGCWNDSAVAEHFRTTSLEACLILGWDADADVATAAQAAVQQFVRAQQQQQSDPYGKNLAIAPRLVELVERLPSVAQSLRSVELEATLKLVRAYLTLDQQQQQQPNESGSSEKNRNADAIAKSLRAAFADKTISDLIVASFKTILDVELEASDDVVPFHGASGNEGSSSNSRKALIMVVDDDSNTKTRTSRISRPSFSLSSSASLFAQLNSKYLNTTTAQHAMEALRALGHILGPKHASLWVDACVADLYEAAMVMSEKPSRTGHAQRQWLHEWLGVVRLIPPLLEGGFAAAEPDDDDCNSKKVQRRKRYLVSLAQSVLPLLTTHPLWTLPTMDGSLTGKGALSNGALPMAPNNARQEALVSGSNRHWSQPSTVVVASTLRGNAALLCGLLDLIGTFIDLMDPVDSSSLAPILLYPLLEKVGQQHPSIVRDGAWSILEKFAVAACGCSDVPMLIAEHWESSLVNSMLSKIRVPGGRSLVPGEEPDDSVCTVVDCATAVFRISAASIHKNVNQPQSCHRGDRSPQSMLTNMEELTRELTTRFDYGSTKVITKDFPVMAFKFVSLFDAAVQMLRAARESGDKSHVPVKDVAEPWFQLLTPFLREMPDGSTLGPRDGFAAYHEEKAKQSKKVSAEDKQYVAELSRDTAFISHLAWRCGYLLSHSTLMIQIRACDVLIQSFAFLGWVANNERVDTGTANGPKTSVLRRVHATWPTIEARLKATCSTTTTANTNSPIVMAQISSASISTNVGEQRIYLAKLLTLIGTMVECSDDFMAKHFRLAVWPRLEDILRSFGERLGLIRQSTRRLNPRGSLLSRTAKMTESENMVLISAMRCICQVYDHLPVGKCLPGLIPSVANVLFPFLNDKNESVAAESLRALKSMLRIDCDSMWRPLYEMSGQRLPECPLKINGLATGPPVTASPATTTAAQREAATELLAFIDSLPEQSLN